MMEAAVNCLVNDASRKFVCPSMGRTVRRSVTPYPRRKTGFPSRTTRTAAPGALEDFRGAKMASTWVGETWAEAVATEKISAQENTAASFSFKSRPRAATDAWIFAYDSTIRMRLRRADRQECSKDISLPGWVLRR